MRRKWKNKLAVSTVVANMLMILITLSLAAILIAWAGTSYGAFTGGAQVFFQQRGQALQEMFVVENVFFNNSQGNTRLLVFVRNVGALDINIVAIYANGTSLTPTGSGGTCVFSAGSTHLLVGQVCEFNLNWGSTWTTGSTFNLVVASARGNQATFTARGP